MAPLSLKVGTKKERKGRDKSIRGKGIFSLPMTFAVSMRSRKKNELVFPIASAVFPHNIRIFPLLSMRITLGFIEDLYC